MMLTKKTKVPRPMKGNSAHTKDVLAACQRMFYVGCWAHYGVREVFYAGFCRDDGMPYIWCYNDYNGTADLWECVPLTSDTTGQIYAWTTSYYAAKTIADAMEFKAEADRRRAKDDGEPILAD